MTIEISVLLPTRGRFERLSRAMGSLFDLAADAGRIEFLLRTDVDQPSVASLGLAVPPHTEIRGERWGYGRMHDYYEQLARAAHPEARLLFVWNDDTEMLTPKWDELLLTVTEPRVQFIRRDVCQTADDTFPVVDRRIHNAVGRLSGHCYVDTWLSHVSRDAGVRHFRNDIVFHHDRLNDQTQSDNVAALRGEHERFGQLLDERAKDAAKIRELLAR